MSPLRAKDSSILARVALYDTLPRRQREQMLKLASQTAQKIGRVMIGVSRTRNAEIRKSADALNQWAKANREYAVRKKPSARPR